MSDAPQPTAPEAFKSPVIAQAITQIIAEWLTHQYHHGGYDAAYFDPRDADMTAACVDGNVDLKALGEHIAAKLGF